MVMVHSVLFTKEKYVTIPFIVSHVLILTDIVNQKYRGQDVAVKMLKVQDMPEEMLDEFDREVDLMNKLRHKNIGKFSHE